MVTLARRDEMVFHDRIHGKSAGRDIGGSLLNMRLSVDQRGPLQSRVENQNNLEIFPQP